MTFAAYNKNLKPFANEFRKKLTDTELLLWLHLRRKQILGIQFYRQKIIGNYIVDFYAPAVRLVIEVDGSQHFEPEGIEKDLSRDSYLNTLEMHVLRFHNHQVRKHLNSVLDEIYRYIDGYSR
jgi:very-short-patch-repair endonuclease